MTTVEAKHANIAGAVAPSVGHLPSLQHQRLTFLLAAAEDEINVQMLDMFRANLRSSFDLDADHLGIIADVKVVVLDVAQAVGEVDHAAVRKLDVKLFHVEVDVALKGDAHV